MVRRRRVKLRNPNDFLKTGDKIKLIRRNSLMNGYSIRPDLDGAIVEISSVEDRINGGIRFEFPDKEEGHGFCFLDAFDCKVDE